MSNQTAFETEKDWKTAADCPCLRLFRAVKVMELTCLNLAVSYTNRINRVTSDIFYELKTTASLWVQVVTPTLELRCATVTGPDNPHHQLHAQMGFR